MVTDHVRRRDFLRSAGAATLVMAGALTACKPGTKTSAARVLPEPQLPPPATEHQPRGRMVSISVASIQYSYDAPWGLFDVASSGKALSADGSVVAEARVTTPMPSAGGISGLDVEEVIYPGDGTRNVAATGSIRFDTNGRVVSYHSTSGMPSPIFDRWPTKPRP